MNTKSFESTESSSPIITRAFAANLRGAHCDNFAIPSWKKQLLLALGILPQGIARQVISRFQTISGLSRNILDNFSIDTLVNQRLGDYAQLDGKFPCITLGLQWEERQLTFHSTWRSLPATSLCNHIERWLASWRCEPILQSFLKANSPNCRK